LAFATLVAVVSLIVFVMDEIGIDEDKIFSGVIPLLPAVLIDWPFTEPEEKDEGDEFTGQVSAWLFGISCLPVAINLIAMRALRQGPGQSRVKEWIKRFNSWQRKHLMPSHTFLTLGALAVAGAHYLMSTCSSTFLPELGLLSMAILVGSGLLIKLKFGPPSFRKRNYQFHASLVISGALVTILFLGHVIVT